MSFSRDPDLAGHLDHVVAGGSADQTPLLWAVSTMVAHTLNNLASPVGLNDEPDPDFEPCDPDECAPCDGLYRLHETASHLLDNLLRPYVESSGGGWDWWVGDAKTGHLDWAYVEARSVRGAHAHYHAE